MVLEGGAPGSCRTGWRGWPEEIRPPRHPAAGSRPHSAGAALAPGALVPRSPGFGDSGSTVAQLE